MADQTKPEFSDTGLWVDQATGQVVESAPRKGVQLVPPGGELRPDRKRAIDAARAEAPQVVEESVTDPEPPKAPVKKAAPKG
jgi:hypothetical protein